MIEPIQWKNLDGLRLSDEQVQAVVLPRLGGKIASLRWMTNGFELAAQGADTYHLPHFGSPFASFDASGLDDAFPSIEPASCGAWSYPDHGEIWSAAMDSSVFPDCIHLVYESPHLPYRYEKTVSLLEGTLFTRYRITLREGESFPCFWTFHGLMRYEEDMRIDFPEGADTFLNVCNSSSFGRAGTLHKSDGAYDFTRVPPRAPKTVAKYYVAMPVRTGSCALRYPSQGMECRLTYDAAKLPYLGFWVTAGGFRGDYNCALEPSNGFYDAIELAKAHNALPLLEAGRPMEFELAVRLQPMA